MSLKDVLSDKWHMIFPAPTLIDAPSVVVVDGYINKETQIEELRRSGQQLVDWREQYYTGGYPNYGDPSDEEDFLDPTARKDFDFDDAERIRVGLNDSYSAAVSKAARRAAAKKGEDPPPSVDSKSAPAPAGDGGGQ